MIRITNQYIWSVVFGLFFTALVVMGVIILDTEAHIAYADLTILDLVIVMFASYRLSRFVVHDEMMRFFREQFYDVRAVRNKMYLDKPKKGPRRMLADLFSCPWHFGIGSVSLILFFYLLTPLAYFPVLIFAIAGGATFLQSISMRMEERSV